MIGTQLAKVRNSVRSKRLLNAYIDSGGDKWVPPVPPPDINFNQELPNTIEDYRTDFLSSARDRELPFLRTMIDFAETTTTVDYGCGLGRLATAFHEAGPEVGTYLGWEPEVNALTWLTSAYREFNERFVFGGQKLDSALNYVTHNGRDNSSELSGAIPSEESWAAFLEGVTPNLFVSQSVFTHMWPEDIVATLKLMAGSVASDGVMVHTWLIVDQVAEEAIKVGAADRSLPHSVRGVRTYSKKNPLVCTAYPIDLMMDVYREADVPVSEVMFGSWAGRGNDFSYQDVVISRF